MSLLLDALQRASEEKEKLAEEQALKEKSDKPPPISEPAERTSFPDLSLDSDRLEPTLSPLESGSGNEPETASADLAAPEFLPQSSALPARVVHTLAQDKVTDTSELMPSTPAELVPQPVVVPAPLPEPIPELSAAERVPEPIKTTAPIFQRPASPQIAREIVGATARNSKRPERRVVLLATVAILALVGVATMIFLPGMLDRSAPVMAVDQTSPGIAAPSTPFTPPMPESPSSAPGNTIASAINSAASTTSTQSADDNTTASPNRAAPSQSLPEPKTRMASAGESYRRTTAKRDTTRRDARVFTATPAPASSLDAAYAALIEGRFDEASSHYRSALKQNAGEIDALLGLAYIAQRQNRNDEARAYYLSVLRQIPNHPGANAGLLSLPSNTDAQVTSSRARNIVERNPNSAVAFASMGNALAKEGRIAEAQQAYFRAVTLEPLNALYNFNLAVALDHLHKNAPAARYYEDAIRLAGNSADSERSGFPRVVAMQRLQQLRGADAGADKPAGNAASDNESGPSATTGETTVIVPSSSATKSPTN